MSATFLRMLVLSVFLLSPIQTRADDSGVDLLRTALNPDASLAQQRTAINKLAGKKLPADAQAQVTEHLVARLTGKSGSLVDLAQLVKVLAAFDDIPEEKKAVFAESLRPLMKATHAPAGDEITLADRCGVAAAIRICDPNDAASSQFLIEQAREGHVTAYFMIGASRATEAIPVLVESLGDADRDSEIYSLILVLSEFPTNQSASEQIKVAKSKLSPLALNMIEEATKSPSEAKSKD